MTFLCSENVNVVQFLPNYAMNYAYNHAYNHAYKPFTYIFCVFLYQNVLQRCLTCTCSENVNFGQFWLNYAIIYAMIP